MEKLIVTAALTGNVPTRDYTPHVPLTPAEIAADVRRCGDAATTLVHIHARDLQGKPTLEKAVFQETARHIKAVAPDTIIQLSTGARAGRDWEARATPVRLLPEMASFTTGSNNLPGIVYENSPDFLLFLAGVFQETGVKPEIEIFEAGMINNALFLQKKQLLTPPLHFDFVLGAPGAMPGTVKNLAFLADSLPPGSTWTVAGIGAAEIPLATAAIAMGGHVRVGFENGLHRPQVGRRGRTLESLRLLHLLGQDDAGRDRERDQGPVVPLPAVW